MSAFAATMRSAACRRTSAHDDIAFGSGSDFERVTPGVGVTVGSGAGLAGATTAGTPPLDSPGARSRDEPQAATTTAAPMAPQSVHGDCLQRRRLSMQGTIDLLGELMRDTFDSGQVGHARVADLATVEGISHEHAEEIYRALH